MGHGLKTRRHDAVAGGVLSGGILSRGGHAVPLAASPLLEDRARQRGRMAKHDRVAMCLLGKGLESALPARQALRIACNRRRLKLALFLLIAWWVGGRFLA